MMVLLCRFFVALSVQIITFLHEDSLHVSFLLHSHSFIPMRLALRFHCSTLSSQSTARDV
jgi:hypothetical protein